MENKLPRNRWRSVKNGESELSKVWYTTERVSPLYRGRVEYDKYLNIYNFRIIEIDGDKTWSNVISYKTLGRAKSQCWRSIMGLPHPEFAENE